MEFTLGQGFRSASKQESDPETDQQVGEVPYHAETLAKTPMRRVGIKLSTNVNGFGPKGVTSPLETKEDDRTIATG